MYGLYLILIFDLTYLAADELSAFYLATAESLDASSGDATTAHTCETWAAGAAASTHETSDYTSTTPRDYTSTTPSDSGAVKTGNSENNLGTKGKAKEKKDKKLKTVGSTDGR